MNRTPNIIRFSRGDMLVEYPSRMRQIRDRSLAWDQARQRKAVANVVQSSVGAGFRREDGSPVRAFNGRLTTQQAWFLRRTERVQGEDGPPCEARLNGIGACADAWSRKIARKFLSSNIWRKLFLQEIACSATPISVISNKKNLSRVLSLW